MERVGWGGVVRGGRAGIWMREVRALYPLAVFVAVALSLGFAPGAMAAGTGSIAGTVTELSAPLKGIEGIEVCAFSGSVEGFGCAKTDSEGKYTISGLPSGEYDVEFSPPFESTLNFVPQYYSGAASQSKATPVSVVAGSSSSGIDAELETGGQITGKVTSASGGKAAIQGIEVCAFSESNELFRCATTGASGEYAVVGLASGEYDVEFTSPFESGLDYLIQYYNDKPLLAEAQLVSVIAGSTHAGIDAELDEGGRITGEVTDAATAAGIPNALVCAMSTTTGESGACAFTNGSGEYTISALVNGSYKVEFFGGAKYVTQYYNDKASFSEAQAISVTAPATTAGIDATMQTVGTPPANTKAPVVSGTPAVGGALLCANGLWTGNPTPTFTEQWLRDGAPMPGANGSSYTVQGVDAGHSLSCRVTAKNVKGERSATSAAVAIPVIPASPTPPAPVITITGSKVIVSGGSAKVGVKCDAATCAGIAELTVKVVVKRRRGKKTVSRKEVLVLAKGSYSLVAGKSATIVLHLTTAGKHRLAHVKHHPLPAKLTLSVSGGTTTNKSVLVR